MHVALVSPRYEDASAGGGAVSAALLVRLLRERGHRVTVLCRESASREPDVLRVPMGPAALARRLRALRPDVVHAYNLDAVSSTVLAAALARRPVVATVNGHTAVCLFGDQLHPARGPCGTCTTPKIRECFSMRPDWQIGRRVPAWVGVAEVRRRTWFLDRADAIFTYSASTRDVLERCGVDASKVRVVPNMADPAVTGVSAREPRILFVGKMDVPKGPDLLLEALQAFLPRFPDWSADLVGEGPLLPSLRERAASDPAISGRVRFPGFVPPGDLHPRYYARAAVLATPVRWEEPFGRIVLEAWAHGLCVVTADRGGHGEIVRDGENGRKHAPGDAAALSRILGELAESPQTMARLGDAGSKGLEAYSPGRILPLYERAYAGIAARHG